MGRLLKLKPDLEEAGASYDVGKHFTAPALFDFDQDGAAEIIFADSEGEAHILGSDLHLIARVTLVEPRFTEVSTCVVGVRDLDGDGRVELVFEANELDFVRPNLGSHDLEAPAEIWLRASSIIVTDDRLRVRLRHELPAGFRLPGDREHARVADVDGNGHAEIVIAGNLRATVLQWKRGLTD